MADLSEREIIAAAYDILNRLLSDDDMKLRLSPEPDAATDAVWHVEAPNFHAQLLVQAFRRFTPRDADRVLGPSGLVRRILRDPVLVAAPWLSPRSRELLTERGVNYIDLTGNIRLRVARPAINFRLEGAQQDPHPPARPPVRLQGSQVNSLVRVLVDFTPPYRMIDLARVSGLSNAYVSRTLDALDDERLIQRDPRSKRVVEVDWPALLRARAIQYDLLKTNQSGTYIARTGAPALYRRLRTEPAAADQHVATSSAVVTGSYAASRLVQIAAPRQLVLYVPDKAGFARAHELMPAQQSADVVLLTAASNSQLQRTHLLDDGTLHVGISQLALDCLAGNGRLPEEGEALLEWMADNTTAWRQPQLPHPA